MRYSELLEVYSGGFAGRNGQVEVFRNPSRRELAALTEHRTVRMFLSEESAWAWSPYSALHTETMFQVGEDVGLTRDAIPILLFYEGRRADCMITDASRRTKWFHNKEAKSTIMRNRYLRSMFNVISVSYFDEDIEGDWEHLEELDESSASGLARTEVLHWENQTVTVNPTPRMLKKLLDDDKYNEIRIISLGNDIAVCRSWEMIHQDIGRVLSKNAHPSWHNRQPLWYMGDGCWFLREFPEGTLVNDREGRIIPRDEWPLALQRAVKN